MNLNKKIKIIFISLIFLFSVFTYVKAQDNLGNAFKPRQVGWSAAKMGFNVSTETESVESIVGIIISTILSFLGIIFLVLIIYGGFLWMTAEGNDQQVEKAQKIIKQATIGIVVVLISYSLSWLILNIFVSTPTEFPDQ